MTLLSRLRHLARRCSYGLFRKFSLFLVVLLIALTATLTTVATLAEQRVSEARLRQQASDMMTMLVDFARDHLAQARISALRHLLVDVVARSDVRYVYVLDPEDRVVADSDPDDGPWLQVVDDPLARAARTRGTGLLIHDRQGLQVAQPVDFGAGQTGVVRLGLSTVGLERDLRALKHRNLVAGLAFLGVSLLLGLVLVGRITRPLARLTASLETVAHGQFDRKIAIRTNDELELLAGAFNRMLSRLEASDAQVRRLAFFDAVTELPNRLHFRQLLGQALAEARRYGNRGAVLFLDLDHFKLINDNFGHDAGDRLLQAFAHRLTACLRGADIVAREGGEGPASAVARLGGDEFTIILGEIGRPDDPARVAERVLATLDHPFDLGEQTVVVGTSIGIALFPDDGIDPETLLKHADLAMYHAKQQGRSNYQFYSSRLGVAAVERLSLERELRTALARNELELYYQPQLQPAGGAVVGLEALLRWRHSRLGILPPCRILELAEDTGLILPIGSWVLRQACAAAKAWSDAGLGPLRIGVNLSALQLVQADFVERLAAVLEASGLAPERLELEITETVAATDQDAMAARRAALKRLGVKLAIDDFGAGHAGLRALKSLRPDQLKIDRGFVQEIGVDAEAAAIVSAIVTLAHSLSLEVAAAGVESELQAECLRRAGCDRFQGFLFSPPLPAAEVIPWLRQRQARPAPKASAETAL